MSISSQKSKKHNVRMSPILHRIIKKYIPPNEKTEIKHYDHFHSKTGDATRKATKMQVFLIRCMQIEGIKRRHARSEFPEIPDGSFNSIWTGRTLAGISHMTDPSTLVD